MKILLSMILRRLPLHREVFKFIYYTPIQKQCRYVADYQLESDHLGWSLLVAFGR